MSHGVSFREHLEEIQAIVGFVFNTMLGMSAEAVSGEWAVQNRSVTAAVYFAGEWKGAVMLECSRDLAFALTEKLADVAKPTELDESVRDALGELANMVGGNLKAILPKGVSLSMPMVVQGSDYLIWFSGGNVVSRLAFECDSGVLWLHLIETEPKTAPKEVIALQ
jgi:CheY-specific phosphatase CheX